MEFRAKGQKLFLGISKGVVRKIEVWGNSIVNLNMAGIEGIELLVNSDETCMVTVLVELINHGNCVVNDGAGMLVARDETINFVTDLSNVVL